jgi:hypothetical protein
MFLPGRFAGSLHGLLRELMLRAIQLGALDSAIPLERRLPGVILMR